MAKDFIRPFAPYHRWLPRLPGVPHGWRTCPGPSLHWETTTSVQQRVQLERMAQAMRRELEALSPARRRACRKAFHRSLCRRVSAAGVTPYDLALMKGLADRAAVAAGLLNEDLSPRSP